MSTAKFDTLSNLAGTQSVPVATVAQGSAKAWVNFDGTGTVAIRASFNVSSITDNGTGNYTVNFTNAMSDTNYAVNISAGTGASGSSQVICLATGRTTTGATLLTLVSAGATFSDNANIQVAIFR